MPPRRPTRLRVLAAAWLAALAVAACGSIPTTSPEPTPADFGGVALALSTRGLAVGHAVSGDAGCSDPALVPTAISMDASGQGQSPAVRLYLYIFANKDSFDHLRASIDACARSYITDPETFASIDESPYVIAGQGPWAAGFEAALRAGLKAAAGNGGTGPGADPEM